MTEITYSIFPEYGMPGFITQNNHGKIVGIWIYRWFYKPTCCADTICIWKITPKTSKP